MSWFSQVSQGPYQQQAADGQRFTVSGFPAAPYNPPGLPAGAQTAAPQRISGAGLLPAGPLDLPSAPRGAASPPSLENLSCAGQDRQPEPISYVTFQEQRCVLSWFQGWNGPQKERFLQDLVGKAVPGKVCTLLDSLSTLQVRDKLPNIFECQLRLWTQWFESWGEEERNHFLHMLEEKDPVFVAHFYRSVAGTAGRD
uniref:Chromosome 14 open reading frame 119 n=1 Tax=Fundulus heteroclitus TaxID=8078 RepID=A0A3Q2PQC5_FUNHE